MANSTQVNGGTVLTIPAGSSWYGSVMLSAALVTAIGSAAATSVPTVVLSGAGGNMNDGDTAVAVALSTPATLVTALAGAQASETCVSPILFIQARANPVKLTLNFGAGVTAVATAFGAIQ